MLNLPIPAATPAAIPAPITTAQTPATVPETTLVPDGRDAFGDLLAATAGLPVPPALPVQPPVAELAPPLPEGVPAASEGPTADASAATESAAAQLWALMLVPELASLPAPAPEPGSDPQPTLLPAGSAQIGDVIGRGVASQADTGLWPQQSVSRALLAVTMPAAGSARPRGWQNALPSGPPALAVSAPPPPASAAVPRADAPAPAIPVLRNITGQPIPWPTADQPPWYDPAQAPPWFDSANPPPPWNDPTRPAPLWYDPTQVPPAWLDPARIPAAWFDPARQPATPPLAAADAAPLLVQASAGRSLPVAPAPPLEVAAPGTTITVTPPTAPLLRDGTPTLRPERPRRLPVAEPALPPAGLAFVPPAVATAATTAPAIPAPPPSQPAPSMSAASDPALAIASERLGEVAVRLSGGPDQLQVAMQAQPAAAALLGAEAPRLSQDLAAAGLALASLSVNGQRADMGANPGGGRRDRQREADRREAEAPLSGVRRLAARAAMNRTTSIDRFA